MILVTLWWLLFWAAIGLGVGSFLNAIIYRLPRNESLRSPLWSACPYCRHRIRWYDNLPVVSFVVLRGRCRDCAGHISTRYPVIELATALVVLTLLDAFCIASVRSSPRMTFFGLTECLTYDTPILVAHIILFACLLSMSAIDLEHYWVDVRFTNLATAAGFVLHAVWTPVRPGTWYQPADGTAIVSLAAVGGLGLVWVLSICRPHMDPEDFGEAGPLEAPPAEPRPVPPGRRPSWAAALVAGGVFVAVLVSALLGEAGRTSVPHTFRAIVPLAFFFALIVCESTVARTSDEQIVEEIEAERHGARRTVLMELVMLAPAIVFGAAALWLVVRGGGPAERMTGVLHTTVHVPVVPWMGAWSPLYGLATAASGYLIGGAIGWAVRIVFTLVLGKEAFGVGDIHMMAAAGCVAGWPVVVLGFILTCGLAIIGWLCTLPFKRSRALPLGPWLSLGFLAVVIFYRSMVEWPIVARVIDAVQFLLTERRDVLPFGLRS